MRLQDPQHDYRLAVDHLSRTGTEVECECYTAGMSLEEEQDTYVRTVTYEELKAAVASKGYVDVTPYFDTDNSYSISFNEWIESVNSEELEIICAGIINKREGRTLNYSPSAAVIAAGNEHAEKMMAAFDAVKGFPIVPFPKSAA